MSYIYLFLSNIEYEQYYKIGHTKNLYNLKKRFESIKTGNPGDVKIVHTFKTKYGTKLEKTLHYYFSTKKMEREWFKLDMSEVNDFIDICSKLEKNYDILTKSDNPFI